MKHFILLLVLVFSFTFTGCQDIKSNNIDGNNETSEDVKTHPESEITENEIITYNNLSFDDRYYVSSDGSIRHLTTGSILDFDWDKWFNSLGEVDFIAAGYAVMVDGNIEPFPDDTFLRYIRKFDLYYYDEKPESERMEIILDEITLSSLGKGGGRLLCWVGKNNELLAIVKEPRYPNEFNKEEYKEQSEIIMSPYSNMTFESANEEFRYIAENIDAELYTCNYIGDANEQNNILQLFKADSYNFKYGTKEYELICKILETEKIIYMNRSTSDGIPFDSELFIYTETGKMYRSFAPENVTECLLTVKVGTHEVEISNNYNITDNFVDGVKEWKNIKKVSLSRWDNFLTAGLTNDRNVLVCANDSGRFAEVLEWTDIVDIKFMSYYGKEYLVGLKSNGALVFTSDNPFPNKQQAEAFENIIEFECVGNFDEDCVIMALCVDGKMLFTQNSIYINDIADVKLQ